MRRPKLLISKCLGFENCRYNGQGSSSKFIDSLKDYVEFCTVCPEVEIGLSTPREAIRIVDYNNEKKLIQPKSNKDYTNQMKKFSRNYISKLEDIDGCILKSKSPSCGVRDVKVYNKSGQSTLTNESNGFFADEILNSHGYLPIENEGRLKNYSIRDEFLTKLFMINNFKNEKCDIKKFHQNNELLLKNYDVKIFSHLNNMCKNEEYENYAKTLFQLLNENRNTKKNIQTILDIYNKYEKYLSLKEKEVFVDNIVKYSKDKIPLSTVLNNVKIYAARFEDEKILSQTIFNPYPESLINLMDSGKGRSL